MKDIEIKETCYKGTRILFGNRKRDFIEQSVQRLITEGFTEMSIPIIQLQETFKGKVGEENNNLMFNFQDRGGRDICLAPEYTAIVQKLASTTFKHKKDVKLFYIQECFRGERPQSGRYRQFTQLGVEILNPTKDYLGYLKDLAVSLYKSIPGSFELRSDVKRGLDYYKDGKGFEISCNNLGAQKQVCGGGEYKGGVGFAFGVDRLLLL
jgi:histidyl-tRNA synthetase